MKNLFNYCYYRISRFYENWGEKDVCYTGSIIIFGSFGFYLLSLLAFIFSVFKIKFSIVLIGSILCICVIISLFFINKLKYKELKQLYKDEKHRKLKGWIVFLYLISSVILFFISLYLFDV